MNFSLQGVACFYLWHEPHQLKLGVLQAFTGVLACLERSTALPWCTKELFYSPNLLNLFSISKKQKDPFQRTLRPTLTYRSKFLPPSLIISGNLQIIWDRCHIHQSHTTNPNPRQELTSLSLIHVSVVIMWYRARRKNLLKHKRSSVSPS